MLNQKLKPSIPLDPTAIYLEEKRLEMIDSERDRREERMRDNFELDKIAKLDNVCRQFWKSPIGEFILDEASKHADQAKNKLVTLSRSDLGTEKFLAEVEAYQQAAHVPALVWTWINNAIQRAKQEGIVHEEEEM